MRIKTATVRELSDAHLMCLLYGHAWGDSPIYEVTLENGLKAWRQDLTCTSCSTTRRDIFEPRTFEVWRRSYEWLPGYGCDEPYDRTDLRRERSTRRISQNGNGQVRREHHG